ncbi:hypothetical protein [Leptospira borgpetersenii]|uniref:hypothetical protein n=1 Tax=Leptospira borgpetersenii TaxID=174 RepID=UPI00034491B3|nr:hypothetical protein [Leptospira borgpetersenii]URD71576.1 hypothetical protein LIX26_16505 [Leptospira borgpetersenii]UVD74778.1 hypothetical protein NU962_16670 [Leptospira borgpetersenii]UVD77963.1 hypothetical protein LIX27_16740 [Leptospira borgpetersenii]UZW34532.1 hypothetical protein OR565_16745 [Leptospira borgpetersenii]
MLTTVLISIAFGALVALFVVFIREEYKNYQMKSFVNSIPKPLAASSFTKNDEEELKRIQKEIIEMVATPHRSVASKLEHFYESLKFQDQILNAIFQSTDNDNHVAITVALKNVMEKVQQKIESLRSND